MGSGEGGCSRHCGFGDSELVKLCVWGRGRGVAGGRLEASELSPRTAGNEKGMIDQELILLKQGSGLGVRLL